MDVARTSRKGARVEEDRREQEEGFIRQPHFGRPEQACAERDSAWRRREHRLSADEDCRAQFDALDARHRSLSDLPPSSHIAA